MEKKTYAKPFFVVERFTPNEFVASCNWVSVIGNQVWNNSYFNPYEPTVYRYVDLDGDGKYDDGERFYASTGMAVGTIDDQITSQKVKVSILAKYNSKQEYTSHPSGLIGKGYGDIFDIGNNHLQFRQNSYTRWFKVKNNQLFCSHATEKPVS